MKIKRGFPGGAAREAADGKEPAYNTGHLLDAIPLSATRSSQTIISG